MRKIIFLVIALFIVFFEPLTSSSAEAACSKTQAVIRNSDEYIFLRVKLPDGTTMVFVYLSDGLTLVNIYEEED